MVSNPCTCAAALLWIVAACSQPPPESMVESGGTMDSAQPAAVPGEEEEDIPLDEVPQAVLDAAQDAVPGIVFQSAEREVEKGVTLYCLEGTADGTEYEVEVSAAGDVVEIESGDDEEDDDDDADGDEDDDD